MSNDAAGKSFFASLGLAFGEMANPRFRAVVMRALMFAVLLLVGLGFLGVWGAANVGTAWGVDWGVPAAIGTIIAWLVALVVLVMPLAAFIMGLYLDSVAEAVERRHYPDDPPGKGAGFLGALGMSLRFMFKLVLVNALALVAYVFLPVLNVLIFLLVNGYLAGREYFEMIAARHYKPAEIRRMRKKNRLKLLSAGAIIAALLAVPGVNFVAPLFGVALMVHVFKSIAARHQMAEA